MLVRELTRYSAYFKGWCQSFGEHESIYSEDEAIAWLFTEDQVGFTLPRQIIKPLYREVLLHHRPPGLKFDTSSLIVGSLHVPLSSGNELKSLDAVERILHSGEQFHCFLTSHLMYGSGVRIMTLSRRRPLPIIYKEIGSMRISLLR
jgi:hypothetical protein